MYPQYSTITHKMNNGATAWRLPLYNLLYTDTEQGWNEGSPTLPHEAGLVQRPKLRRDARLHRLHADAAEVVAVCAHLVVETWRALCCPGSTRRHGARLLRWVLWAATAAANPPRGTEDRAQRARKRAQGWDPARCSRVTPRTGLAFPPPVPPRRYRPRPTDVPWARARDGSRALDGERCRRPSRRRAW